MTVAFFHFVVVVVVGAVPLVVSNIIINSDMLAVGEGVVAVVGVDVVTVGGVTATFLLN